jgi:hypothetical protein
LDAPSFISNEVELLAWQIARATASAASSGFGTAASEQILRTISITCFFSARP